MHEFSRARLSDPEMKQGEATLKKERIADWKDRYINENQKEILQIRIEKVNRAAQELVEIEKMTTKLAHDNFKEILEIQNSLSWSLNYVFSLGQSLDPFEEKLPPNPELLQKLSNIKKKLQDIQNHTEDLRRSLFFQERKDVQEKKFDRNELKKKIQELLENGDYDDADIFVDRLLNLGRTPRIHEDSTHQSLENFEMVHYQPTRISEILTMIDAIDLNENDTLCDIGTGLGRVPMITNILTGAKSIGIEYQPIYTKYAQERKQELGLDDVIFENIDARDADFSTANVFYMFNPFVGDILESVTGKLYIEAKKRKIIICTLNMERFHEINSGDDNWLTEITPKNNRSGIKIYESKIN